MDSLRQHIAQKVWEAIETHKTIGLNKMTTQQISYLPQQYLQTLTGLELEQNWKYLPAFLQNSELKNYLYCLEHSSHNYIGGDCGDCPSVRKINCPICLNG